MTKVATGVVAFLLLGGVSKADILVSGDINIGDGMYGTLGGIVGDNGRFFSNVLGTGRKVVLEEGTIPGYADYNALPPITGVSGTP